MFLHRPNRSEQILHSLLLWMGADKDAFSVRYEVELRDKKPAQSGGAGQVVGLAVGPTGGLRPFKIRHRMSVG
jgi:hypothetical protein